MKEKFEKRSFDFEVRDAIEIEGKKTLTGHAAVFNQQTRLYGNTFETIANGAFSDRLNDDCYALFNHNPSLPIASTRSGTLRLSEDQTGLCAEIEIPDTTLGNDLWKLIKSGIICKMSFGFSAKKDQITVKNQPDGSTHVTINKVQRLFDVSPVTYPAYDGTDISAEMRSAIEESKIMLSPERLEQMKNQLKKINDLKKMIAE